MQVTLPNSRTFPRTTYRIIPFCFTIQFRIYYVSHDAGWCNEQPSRERWNSFFMSFLLLQRKFIDSKFTTFLLLLLSGGIISPDRRSFSQHKLSFSPSLGILGYMDFQARGNKRADEARHGKGKRENRRGEKKFHIFSIIEITETVRWALVGFSFSFFRCDCFSHFSSTVLLRLSHLSEQS